MDASTFFKQRYLKIEKCLWQRAFTSALAGIVTTAGILFFVSGASAEVIISLEAIKTIESGGNPYAVSESTKCYGLYQISEICLKDYNEENHTRYSLKDLFKPAVNQMIASWYFKKIGKILSYYNIPITLTTIIASYNWGIGNAREWVRRGMKFEELPAETRGYIKKYAALMQRLSPSTSPLQHP
jgi:hypothetical protein